MKNQVQSTGNRKWFGSDFILLQDEIYSALSAFFADYGNCIISGGVFTYSDEEIGTLKDGYAYLTDEHGQNGQICKIIGDTFSTRISTVYLTQGVKTYPEISSYGRDYETGGKKAIIYEYYAEISTSVPAHSHYIAVSGSNNTHFRNKIQTTLFRFVTDREKTTWNNNLAASSYTADDVLEKLLTVDTNTAGINATTIKSVTPTSTALYYFNLGDWSAKILTDLKTVHGPGSGLNADLLDNYNSTDFQFAANMQSTNTALKGVKRDASGNFAAGTITVTDIIIV